MKIIVSHQGVKASAESGPAASPYPVEIKCGTINDTLTRDQAKVLAALLLHVLRATENGAMREFDV